MMIRQQQSRQQDPLHHNKRLIIVTVTVLLLILTFVLLFMLGITNASTIISFVGTIVGLVVSIHDLLPEYTPKQTSDLETSPSRQAHPHVISRSPLFWLTRIKRALLPFLHHRDSRIDLQEAPRRTQHTEKRPEFFEIKKAITKGRSSLTAIIGTGGVGKTTMALKIVETIDRKFDFVLWFPLRNPQPLQIFIQRCVSLISKQQVVLPDDTQEQLRVLLSYLRKYRCLLILDNIESILQPNSYQSQCLPAYKDYDLLFQAIGTGRHKSCLLITSRELPEEVVQLKATNSGVQSFSLSGLEMDEAYKLIESEKILANPQTIDDFIKFYQGIPLALLLAIRYSKEHLGSDLSQLSQSEHHGLIGDIRTILDQQFDRLSPLEIRIMYLLAVEREPLALPQIQKDLFYKGNQHQEIHDLEKAVSSLKRRFLIENIGEKVSLQNVILEYTVNHLIHDIFSEIQGEAIHHD